MSRNDSAQISDFFTANSLDVTPASVLHAARILYVPVSSNPEVTDRCASVLSDAEDQRADRFAAQDDKALFIQRRAFRRFCGGVVLGSTQPMSQALSRINFEETERGRPYLPGAPDVWFSFSSCRFGFLGAWSSTHAIGVDLEDHSRRLEVAKLAEKFFSATEAAAVEGPGEAANQQAFFQLWSLKEAALKSIGEGLPFGLDAFEFELHPDLRMVHAPLDHGGQEQFQSQVIEMADNCAAVVIRSLESAPLEMS
jgi:phosphopantetheine--protein transferase-like protein